MGVGRNSEKLGWVIWSAQAGDSKIQHVMRDRVWNPGACRGNRDSDALPRVTGGGGEPTEGTALRLRLSLRREGKARELDCGRGLLILTVLAG